MSTPEIPNGELLGYVFGPLGVLAVLLLAVKWLTNMFEKEQNKREQAYFTVIEMYQDELKYMRTQYDGLHSEIKDLARQISALLDHNSKLLNRLEAIEAPVIRLLTMIEEEYRKAK